MVCAHIHCCPVSKPLFICMHSLLWQSSTTVLINKAQVCHWDHGSDDTDAQGEEKSLSFDVNCSRLLYFTPFYPYIVYNGSGIRFTVGYAVFIISSQLLDLSMPHRSFNTPPKWTGSSIFSELFFLLGKSNCTKSA